MSLLRPCFAFLLLTLSCISPLCAADEAGGTRAGKENSLIDEPEVALRKFTVAPGLKVDLFAAEPDARNPVAISIDEHGRVFVVESDRRRSSVFDIRGHKDWLDADFSFRTVQERADFLKQQVSPTNRAVIKRLTAGGRGSFEDFNKDGIIDWRDLEVQSERIRLLEDTNGDGRADRVSVFADGFTNIVAGVAAGVLVRRDEVYFACIPDLWRLRSPNFGGSSGLQTGTQNSKLETQNLLSGFGVHIAFGGHDMHGLIFGPDGKLYWSIADRGTDTNLFARIKNPIPGLTPELLADSGCVFRANPDGTDLEVIAWGLRNPQELAFDEFGNLFTADNNGDGGDKARWHYVVEGADFGWRIGWQWLEARAYQPKMGPWNGERLWHLAESNTAAYLLPPLAHIGHGPAGLAYNPGTGLPRQFDRHFFLCDFPGYVLMWTNIPDGASFKIGPVKNFFGDLGPTDVAFHPDGGVLVSDWFKSFDKSDKGRLYRIHDPATDAGRSVQETKRLLAEGMTKRSVKELADMLGHADMRVRLEAQWELASKATSYFADASFERIAKQTTKAIITVAKEGKKQVARLHALWALGQIAASMPDTMFVDELLEIVPLLHDSDMMVKCGAARLLGSARLLNASDELRALILDNSTEVRFHALLANRDLYAGFSRNGGPGRAFGFREKRPALQQLNDAIDANLGRPHGGQSMISPKREVFQTLEENEADDRYLFHAGVMLLDEMLTFDLKRLKAAPGFVITNYYSYVVSMSPRTRMALLQAYRRHAYPGITHFFSDPDPQIVLEAARAINDVPIPDAFPQLAALISPDGSSPLLSGPGFSPVSGRANANAVITPSPRAPEAAKAAETITTISSAGLKSGANERELAFFALRRVLNVNFRLGHPTNALALAAFAARNDTPEPLRIEALDLLADWPKPPGRDHFMGLWRPLPPRGAAPAAEALRPVLASLLRDAPKGVRLAAVRAAATLGVQEDDLFALVSDANQLPEVRVEALKTLSARNDSRLPEALKLALDDKAGILRIEAGRLRGASGDAVEQWAGVLERGDLAEKQGALASIAAAHPPDADTQLKKRLDDIMSKQLDSLLAGRLPKELQLDVLNAAQELKSGNLAGKLAQYESSLPKNDLLASYRPALHGGNAAAGKTLFIENQQIACFRCHKINGEGGDVGPDLTGVGERKGREYLLQSIVQPNKEIAVGFESVLIEMKSGASYAGLVKSETAADLVLNSPEDGLMTLKKADIKSRQRGLSAMPEEMVTFLTRRELRDLIEFLAISK